MPRLDRLLLQAVRSHGGGEAFLQRSAAMGGVESRHFGDAQHGRPVEQQQAYPARNSHGVEIGRRSCKQCLAGWEGSTGQLLDHRRDLTCFPFYDRPKHAFLSSK